MKWEQIVSRILEVKPNWKLRLEKEEKTLEGDYLVKVETDYGVQVYTFRADSISDAIKQGEVFGKVLDVDFDSF